jgi:hypothetical protein
MDCEEPDVDVCTECDDLVVIEERSIETAGQLETERDYHVIRLRCGHELSWPVRSGGRGVG